MQSVIDAFSVEEVSTVRQIAQSVQVAWKKDYRSGITFFTIGVSRIGQGDVIAGYAGAQSAWNKYLYEDESAKVTSISYDRSLNMPIGGMTKAIADVKLDNTSGRYTPRYAGGSSAIFTAVGKPRRPIIINAGVNVGGVDMMLPQFVGVTSRSPVVDGRAKTIDLAAEDFIGFIQNQYVDQSAMFTSQRSDQIMKTALTTLGFSTAQYSLDYGINLVDYAEFKQGDKFGDIINKLAQAEFGHFYQDETGKLRFDNRQKWDSYPYNNVQRIITTAQVLNAKTPDADHIINVVEVKAAPRSKQQNQLVWSLAGSIEIPASSTKDVFINFDDPMLAVTKPTTFVANTNSSNTGTDLTSNVSIDKFYAFARAVKLTFRNTATVSAFVTDMNLYGRPAKVSQEIYYREVDGSSRTAYEERIYSIENEYIQSSSWAQSFARMILNDFSEPENIQKLTIRGMAELQFGDLISWQGRYWRIFGVATKIDPGNGFVQDIDILQRTISTYFRIGISTIGSKDMIAP